MTNSSWHFWIHHQYACHWNRTGIATGFHPEPQHGTAVILGTAGTRPSFFPMSILSLFMPIHSLGETFSHIIWEERDQVCLFKIRSWSQGSIPPWRICALWKRRTGKDKPGSPGRSAEQSLPTHVHAPHLCNHFPLNGAEIWKTAMWHMMKPGCMFIMNPLRNKT